MSLTVMSNQKLWSFSDILSAQKHAPKKDIQTYVGSNVRKIIQIRLLPEYTILSVLVLAYLPVLVTILTDGDISQTKRSIIDLFVSKQQDFRCCFRFLEKCQRTNP